MEQGQTWMVFADTGHLWHRVAGAPLGWHPSQ
jgi:hypothetical protein